MTYSIVALDPETGELGIAVATGGPAVGAMVPWVEPGVGAVATQSFTNVDLGPLALARLRAGLPAPVALRELMEADPSREVRQLGVVDLAGASAAHTGRDCVAEAGHVSGSHLSAQANMVERPDVWLAMQVAFSGAEGDLADRLVEALRAAEREGGDIRGTRSAALLVAPGAPATKPWVHRFDLRVDSSPQPLEELGRLLRLGRAYEAFDAAMDANKAGELGLALERITTAHELAPEEPKLAFWLAMALATSGRSGEAGPVLEDALRLEPRLAEFGHRYADAGHGSVMTATLRALPRTSAAGPARADGSPGDDAQDGGSGAMPERAAR
ncbi:MAG: DUF1028 domain-containing protein [Chloroflexota bacterium]|jgi:uncharacterized Ntn-hydrolase superfamily protein